MSKSNKNLMDDQCDAGYLDLRFYGEDQKTFQLKVPVIYDSIKKCLLAFYRFKDGKIIHVNGKDSLELQNKFNVELKKYIQKSTSLILSEDFIQI